MKNPLKKLLCFIAGLTVGFIIIYIAFFFQIGFPPGNDLSSSDWLSFLGAYLGFAGSAFFAYMVYLHTKEVDYLTAKINTLQIAEYTPVVTASVLKCKISSGSTNRGRYAIEFFDENKSKHLCLHYIMIPSSPTEYWRAETVETTSSLGVFVRFQNIGKLSVDALSIKEISVDNGKKSLKYQVDWKNKKVEFDNIQPAIGSVDVYLSLLRFPITATAEKPTIMKITLTYYIKSDISQNVTNTTEPLLCKSVFYISEDGDLWG